MKYLYITFILLFSVFVVFAQSPCTSTNSLNGGSVYIDHTTNPPMMTASVNGVAMYDYLWTNGANASQTQYYSSWCVTITDLINGCDTTICENCIADTTALCPCPLIFAPVCGCDGIQYANDCIADCAGVGWTPAIPSGIPGGFLPCTQSSACDVEVSGDSIICAWGVSQNLIASPAASSLPFISYIWNTTPQTSGPILTISTPGTYCVTATDSVGCVATECFTVSVQDIPIFSMPNPPIVCLGDTIILEIDTFGLTNIVWVGPPSTIITPNPIHRVEVVPTFSAIYVVEAIDTGGCDRRGSINIQVDSCISCIDPTLIDSNIICPSIFAPVCGCDGITYNNDCEAQNWYGVTSWIQGPCVNSTWDCIAGACIDPGTGMGMYTDSIQCVFNCIPPPNPTWDCVGNSCIDPGTGMGMYTDSMQCVLNCITPPNPTWNCVGGTCIDPGTGLGSFTDSMQCVYNCIIPPSPTWDCVGTSCIDPGTGMGMYTDSMQCVYNCITTDIINIGVVNKGKLIKIIDVLGRETKGKKNETLFYIYDSGIVEKRIVIE